MADNQIVPVNPYKNGQPVFPPTAQTPTPQGPPVPPEILAAMHESPAPVAAQPPPVVDNPPPAPTNVPGLDAPQLTGINVPQGTPTLPPEISDLVQDESATGNGIPKRHKGVLEHIADFMPLVGMIGGAMEAAGDSSHPPVGAELLQHTLQGTAQRNLEREKMQNVDMPLAQAHSDYFRAAAPAKISVAGINAGAKTQSTTIANRFKMTPGGLYDSQVGSLIPETTAGIMVTPEIAEQYQLPPQFVGKPMKLTDLAASQNAISRNLTTVQGEKGPALVNKIAGTGKDLGLGSPAKAGAENAAVQVWRTGQDGKPMLQTISRAEQLKTGEPSAQVQFAETGPTSSTRNMSQMAQTIEPHLDTLRSEVKELAPYLGPLMGRGEVNFLAGTVGSTGNPTLDYKLGRLMSDFKLASSAVGRTHFAGRTGLPAAQYFGELFNAKRTPEELMGVLDSVPSYIEGYNAMGNFSPSQPLNPVTPKGSSPTPPSPNGNTSKATPVYHGGRQIGTATPEQQKRGTYTPLKPK